MLFDRLEFGDEGLLLELWLGLTAGDGLVGNKLLMLNFPMGEDCGGNELTGLDIGGITLVEDEAVKLPLTSRSNDPRMDELPSELPSLLSDLLPMLLSLLPLGGEAGSMLGVLRKRGLPTHCCI